MKPRARYFYDSDIWAVWTPSGVYIGGRGPTLEIAWELFCEAMQRWKDGTLFR